MTSSNTTKYYRKWDSEKEFRENGKVVLRLPKKVVDNLTKKQYGVFGHSAVQVCGWTKKALKGKGACYKQKFYGIECHSCMEFSPAVMWCQENCSFCWRPMEFMKNVEIKEDEVDSPKEIVDTLLKKREQLLSGFNVNHGADIKKLEQAKIPSHFAISLSGEPTMYPHLDKIVGYLKTFPKTKSIFIVTNAQIPQFFEKLQRQPQSLPTQLYISLEAPTKEIFDKVNKSLHSDGWERLLKSLEIFSTLKCRRLIRFTQIRGLNDSEKYFPHFKKLVEIGKPDFFEVKAYMHLGMSRNRHKKDDMPQFTEVLDFAKKLSLYFGNYEYVDCAPNSRIALLRRKDSKYSVYIGKDFEDVKKKKINLG